MSEKPSIPKGTRDFGPDEMVRRNYIFETIKKYFKRYGFLPIETPAMENLKTLMGKYGDEGDKLLFKIRSNKNLREQLSDEQISILNDAYNYWLPQKSDKALRYDLTVPFARFVVQHQNEITFPFKRYQIQPVWRGDRPQKGRYREFYQCDADMIGSNSLLNEVELVCLLDDVFTELNVSVNIKINNRKILQGIADYCGCSDKFMEITIAIDKLDKIGEDGVKNELINKGFNDAKINEVFACLFPKFEYTPFNDELDVINNLNCTEFEAKQELLLQNSIYRDENAYLNCLYYLFKDSNKDLEVGLKGIDELKLIFRSIVSLYQGKNHFPNLTFDNKLARGLNYYTGAIFEVKSVEGNFQSSICGGGRYDDLTGIFGLPNMSGVGISFGADRIYDVMNDLNLFPSFSSDTTKLMFVNFGEKEAAYCMQLLREVRGNNINSELYPDNAKMAKQMKYANDKQIPFVALIGSSEMENKTITLKNMESGEQQSLSLEKLIEKLK